MTQDIALDLKKRIETALAKEPTLKKVHILAAEKQLKTGYTGSYSWQFALAIQNRAKTIEEVICSYVSEKRDLLNLSFTTPFLRFFDSMFNPIANEWMPHLKKAWVFSSGLKNPDGGIRIEVEKWRKESKSHIEAVFKSIFK